MLAHIHSDGAEHVQLCVALHVETTNACSQCLAHFGAGFAHAGKNHLAHVATCGDDTLQLAARDDVKTTTCLREDLQHRQRGVGLHRITNLRLAARKTTLVGGQCAKHGGFGVHKQRGGVLPSQVAGGHPFGKKLLVAVGDMGLAGQGGVGHGAAGEGVAGAGVTGVAGGAAAGLPGSCGVTVWGRVARFWAAASVGRYSGPRWPQAARAAVQLARAIALTKIR